MRSPTAFDHQAAMPMPTPISHSFPPCHLCAADGVAEVMEFRALRRVTSDCRPWEAGGRLGVCPNCGAVQSAVDEAWQAEVREIYRGYAMFHHRTGTDHAIPDPQGAAMQSRSERLLENALAWLGAPDQGHLLDIGCGNGPLLRAMGRLRPGWTLAGAEQSATVRDRILALPRVTLFHAGPLDELEPGFDLVSVVHVLEHVAEPTAFLRQAARLLAPGGSLLIQVPSFADNPFDAAVADHCTHFTPQTLVRIVETAGLKVRHRTDWIPKEISLVASPANGVDTSGTLPVPASATTPAQAGNLELANRTVSWLSRVAAEATALSSSGPFGLLGTSIAATWLDAQVTAMTGRADILFFADEDPVMRGQGRLGRPVLGIDEIPAEAILYCPMPRSQAEGIRDRLVARGARFRIVIPLAF